MPTDPAASPAADIDAISAIERMTTLEVTEVNIVVHDVHVPNQDTDEPVDSRVE